jgi:hypothetical protein
MQTTAPHVVQKTLRQAQLYGYVVVRNDRMYHPGGNNPLCSLHLAKEIAKSGWLRLQGERFEITPEGLKALASASTP